MKNTIIFAPIRKNEDGEFVGHTDSSCCLEQSQRNTASSDKLIPQWAKDNPVQRFGKFQLVEVP